MPRYVCREVFLDAAYLRMNGDTTEIDHHGAEGYRLAAVTPIFGMDNRQLTFSGYMYFFQKELTEDAGL